jgi:hypothetical protein
MTTETTNSTHEANTPDPCVIREVVATDWETLEDIYWTLEGLALDLGADEPEIELVQSQLFQLHELLRAQVVVMSLQDIVTELVVGDQDPERTGHLASLHWRLADGDPVPNRLYRVEELTGFPDAQLEALARRYEDKLRLAAKDDCIPDEASDAA